MSYKTYKSLATVKARKVTKKEGETVVTSNGVQRAEKGDFVILDEMGGQPTNRVLSADEFASLYDTGANKTPTATSENAPPTVAGTEGEGDKTPDPAKSAAERVKAAKAAQSAKK